MSPHRVRVLVLGTGANGLGIIRSLYRYPELDLFAVNFDKKDPGRFTRFARILDWSDSDQDLNGFQRRLYDLSRNGVKTILFPTRDREVDYLAELSEILPANLVYYRNSIATVKSLTDKKLVADSAKKAGLFIPKTLFMSEKIDLRSTGLNFPVIIKPLITYSGQVPFKTLIVDNEEEFERIFTEQKNLLNQTVVQEFIPGGDDQVHECILLINDDLQTIGALEFQKIRQYLPQKGITSYGHTILSRSITGLSERLANEVGYKGLISFEFKRDAQNDRWALIEANLRLPVFNAVFPVTGVNFAYLYVKSLVARIEHTVFPIRTGNWMHEENDLANILTRKVHTPLKVWFHQLRKTNAFAYWHFGDPLPGLLTLWRIFLLCFKKIFLQRFYLGNGAIYLAVCEQLFLDNCQEDFRLIELLF